MAHSETPDAPKYANTKLRRVDWAKDLDTVRPLFQDYRQWLAEHGDTAPEAQPRVRAGLTLIDRLISELPGAYGPPRGDVILALDSGSMAACGALRELEPSVGEIKRIFVRPSHRGPGFGPTLTNALLDRARELGYERVRVDTLPTMAGAIQFYQDMGFTPTPEFWSHPVAGAVFFEYVLRSAKSPRSHR
jgi:putative acetyltransferase